jgi:hypothetical protein
MLVVFALSTSVKTAPKPDVKEAVVLPGTKKFTSVIVLPIAVNKRGSLNAWNVFV